MKITKKLLEQMIKEEMAESYRGKAGVHSRERRKEMNRGVGRKYSGAKINSFKDRAVPTFAWIESMDNWLISVAANPQMAELGYQYDAISDEATSAISSARENSSLSQGEFDVVLSALEYINQKIEEITLHPVGGPSQQEKILNYRRPASMFTMGSGDFIRGEE